MALPTRKEVAPALRRVLHRLGGEASVRDVIPLVTAEFPEIPPEELARTLKKGMSVWENRIHWGIYDLRKQGDVRQPEDGKRGKWTLTEQGREKAAAEARGESLSVGLEPLSQDFSAGDEDDEPAPQGDDDVEPKEPRGRVLPDEAERIASALKVAGTDSANPKRLETAVADALRFLGFDVEQIGGPGRTDVFAAAELGIDRYAVVLDAKSTASGKVNDHQIDWVTIQEHQRQERADLSCVVGPAFATGRLPDRAREHRTRLLTTGQLAQVVRVHAASPLSLKELERLFDVAVETATALHDLEIASGERTRRRWLPLELMSIIDSFNRTMPNKVLATPTSLLGSLISNPGGPYATRESVTLELEEEVESALALLETHGALRRSNGEGYVSQTSVSGAKQMLEAAPSDDDEE